MSPRAPKSLINAGKERVSKRVVQKFEVATGNMARCFGAVSTLLRSVRRGRLSSEAQTINLLIAMSNIFLKNARGSDYICVPPFLYYAKRKAVTFKRKGTAEYGAFRDACMEKWRSLSKSERNDVIGWARHINNEE